MSTVDASPRILRAVAVLEAIKGAIVLCAGFGLLALLHHDVRRLAVALVTRLHLDPAGAGAGLFVKAAAALTDARLWGLAAAALAYSVLRAVEAYGLWFTRSWAAWLGAVGGALYIPIEVFELWRHPSLVKAGTLTLNLLVVAYLATTLRQRAARPAQELSKPPAR